MLQDKAQSSDKAATLQSNNNSNGYDFLAGGGEMGELIRAKDWSKTPLSSFENWSQSLQTIVRIMLASRQPIWIGWGPELIKLYNDPYKASGDLSGFRVRLVYFCGNYKSSKRTAFSPSIWGQ